MRIGLAIVALAAVQAMFALSAFASAASIHNAGDPLPVALRVAVAALGVPGIYIAAAFQETLGDPIALYVGFGIGGIVWGGVIVLIATSWLRDRHLSTPAPRE